MARLFELKEIVDPRGNLAVMQEQIPFQIKRVFFVYDVPKDSIRGGHRHRQTKMVLICTGGECTITCDNGKEKKNFVLNKANQCLLLEPEDFHWMKNFSKHACLIVLASHVYDANDYIHEEYAHD
jgi:dTDP-4-dehydrorhamnose 3,5-epimerase-like enzyme